MNDADAGRQPADDEPQDEAPAPQWPIKGPATPRQALLAIGFVFFLGVVIGFVLARTF
ncbi:MAG: hypothetical protein JO050_08340 [Acidimicrobiia bacterium]|nr:hypothetical protein [Acidimicrobiia bacterium]